MTIALVASCTKTEIRYDEPNQISFAPVAKVSTKAAIEENSYPINLPLYVFANTEKGQAYLNNVQFTYDNTANAFVNATAYWPNVDKLVFSGVSASGNVGDATSPADVVVNFTATPNTLTIGGTTAYIQPDEDNNDLLWFPTTAEYGKQSNAVEVVMQHACALLKFNFIAESGLTGWKIKSLVVNDLYKSGKAVCTVVTENQISTPTVTWTTSGTTSTLNVYERKSDAATTEYTIKNDSYITPENIANNTIVIPQTPGTLSVTYEFTSQAGETIEETVSVPLSIGEGKKWQSGYRYTYNITMGAEQIKIAPKASTWGDYDADSTTDGTQNIEKTVQ